MCIDITIVKIMFLDLKNSLSREYWSEILDGVNANNNYNKS